MPSSNPRYKNPKKREAARRWALRTFDNCALCGYPIDKSLSWFIDDDGKKKKHPYSAELDEIIPISKGGSPIDHDNLQLVHRICNQRKGNKILLTNEQATQGHEKPSNKQSETNTPMVAKVQASRVW